jgi:hypothetical protein
VRFNENSESENKSDDPNKLRINKRFLIENERNERSNDEKRRHINGEKREQYCQEKQMKKMTQDSNDLLTKDLENIIW